MKERFAPDLQDRWRGQKKRSWEQTHGETLRQGNAGMATILDFRIPSSRVSRPPVGTSAAHAAEIVILPCVRYERQDETSVAALRKRRSRQRDLLEIED